MWNSKHKFAECAKTFVHAIFFKQNPCYIMFQKHKFIKKIKLTSCTYLTRSVIKFIIVFFHIKRVITGAGVHYSLLETIPLTPL